MTRRKSIDFGKVAEGLSDEELISLFLSSDSGIDVVKKTTEDDNKESSYPTDPVKFAKKILDIDFWDKQQDIAYSVVENKNTVVPASKGVGKCQGENSNVLLADGRFVKAKTLIDQRFKIMGFDYSDWSMRPMDAYAESNGIKDVWRITTKTGIEIERTGNHPLLLWDGWESVNNLKEGDRIAIPLQISSVNTEVNYGDNEIALLAYLLADGGITHMVAFSQNDGLVLDDFVRLIDGFECKLYQHTTNKATYSISKKSGRFCQNSSQANPVKDWCIEQGIFGHNSFTKFIPDWIFSLPDDKIALFLNRLFACDGWICKRKSSKKSGKQTFQIGYCSASEELIDGVRLLALRLGIPFKKRKKYNKTFKTYSYSLEVIDTTSILRFFSTVGFPLGKEKQSHRAYNVLIERDDWYSKETDLLDINAWSVMPTFDGIYKDSIERYGIPFVRTTHARPSRRIVSRYEKLSGNSVLHGWSESNIGWDEIKSIEYVGEQKTVAIFVPETNAYVTEVIDHNSVVVAALVCWWMSIYEDAVVITLAPSAKHVNSVIWRYIRQFGRTAHLSGTILDTPEWKHYDTPERTALGLSTYKRTKEEITSLQGYHSPHLLVIMDEAASMGQLVFDTVRGLATSDDNRVVAIGNPIARMGPFYNATLSPNWNYIHISALETPNAIEKTDIIPGITSYNWIKEAIIDHCKPCQPGEEANEFAFEFEGTWYLPDLYVITEILGLFPSESERQLIPLAWIKTANILEVNADDHSAVVSVDVSRGGDDAALLVRKGLKVIYMERKKPINKKDPTQEIVDWTIEMYRKFDCTTVFVDAIGVGAGVADGLRRQGIPTIDVIFSGSPQNGTLYANLRAEVYWSVRTLLQKEMLELPEDDLLEAELTEIMVDWDNLGRFKMENKDEIRKRLGRSPDMADALTGSFALGIEIDLASVERAELQKLVKDSSYSGTQPDPTSWYSSMRGNGSRWRSHPTSIRNLVGKRH